jgi:hypothetical protein
MNQELQEIRRDIAALEDKHLLLLSNNNRSAIEAS